MRQTLLTFLLSFIFFAAKAQPFVQGEIIIQLEKGANINELIAQFSTIQSLQGVNNPFVINEKCGDLGIYLLRFDANLYAEETVLDFFKKHSAVLAAQYNYKIESRGYIPNDQFYSEQKYLTLIGIPTIWENNRGGLSADGDTIVVAVLENEGIDVTHPDLLPNIWKNRFEIANNGIDDDANGYIDDVVGWNIKNQNDQHRLYSHGTSVSAIVGARGDNNIGVAGINHHIKMLCLTNLGDDFGIIEAYHYVLKQRTLYNNSKGKKGAFVVTTNASFGRGGFPKDSPIWCNLYEEMGRVGILSVGATDNKFINVDVQGDLPSTCPSDYLIAVTRTDMNDVFEKNAGYGKINIDLSAPGKDIFTAIPSSRYNIAGSGTSFATPQVTGAIALLYANPSCEWMKLAKNNPALAALKVKDLILSNVTPITLLKSITVSGGRLNVQKAYEAMQKAFVPCKTATNLLNIFPNPTQKQLNIQFSTSNLLAHRLLVFNSIGQLMTDKVIYPNALTLAEYYLDVEGWARGIYFLKIVGNEHQTEVAKFVVD